MSNKFKELRAIVSELREKCPWDKKQTFNSLRSLTIEEVYELSEEIINKKHAGIEEETGDLLLHVLFYAKLGEETGKFSLDTIIDKLTKKLKTRHPHIYKTKKNLTAEEVEINWEKIKKLERKSKGTLSNISKNLPAVVKAMRIQEKVKTVGFDWENKDQVIKKITEEFEELKKEMNIKNNIKKTKNELGDLFFSVINLARFIDIDPEEALEKTNRKFISRFSIMEKIIEKDNLIIEEMDLLEMDKYWEKSKKINNE